MTRAMAVEKQRYHLLKRLSGHARVRAAALRKEESAEDEEDGQQARLGLSGMASEVRDGRSDGERSQSGGTRRVGPREGDLDVLSATTTASGRVQRSGRNKSEQKRRAQIDSCWCNIPDMFVDPASRAAYYWMVGTFASIGLLQRVTGQTHTDQEKCSFKMNSVDAMSTKDLFWEVLKVRVKS
ncbi:uncharacterized protein [Littorina saxatilis]|uniref:uncharacterized protein n=1 Tax=Littorina saxatilis TaxID=31220 RepID=UPI0038B48E0E